MTFCSEFSVDLAGAMTGPEENFLHHIGLTGVELHLAHEVDHGFVRLAEATARNHADEVVIKHPFPWSGSESFGWRSYSRSSNPDPDSRPRMSRTAIRSISWGAGRQSGSVCQMPTALCSLPDVDQAIRLKPDQANFGASRRVQADRIFGSQRGTSHPPALSGNPAPEYFIRTARPKKPLGVSSVPLVRRIRPAPTDPPCLRGEQGPQFANALQPRQILQFGD